MKIRLQGGWDAVGIQGIRPESMLKPFLDQVHTDDDIMVYPRTFYTDVNGLWLMGEWH
jgi:hypothetical protein